MEDKVIQWNIIAGNDPDDKSLIETYKNLCIEEMKELIRAKSDEDIMDACLDLIYVGFFLNRLYEGKNLKEKDNMWINSLALRDGQGEVTLEDNINSLWDLKEGKYNAFTSDFITYLFDYYQYKFNIVDGFNVVTKSNYSKYSTHDLDLDREVEYIKSQGRYDDIFYEKVGDYVVFRATHDSKENKHYPKGKIMKPSTFISVEDLGGLSEFIY
jgi:hypothetical protein